MPSETIERTEVEVAMRRLERGLPLLPEEQDAVLRHLVAEVDRLRRQVAAQSQ